MSDRTTPITRRQEIALVTGRELRAHLLKKSTIILTLVLLIAAVALWLIAHPQGIAQHAALAIMAAVGIWQWCKPGKT